MATLKKELREILDRYGIDYRDKDKLWDCHGTLVLYHKAYEQMAAQEKIRFDPPIVLEANGAAKSVALCVVGYMGDRAEWATGEAAPGNNKNAYPYAMAEKRAKDRCIAKLVGLAAYVLSEDEADELKNGDRKAVDVPENGNGQDKTAAAPRRDKFEVLDPNGKRLSAHDAPEDWCDAARIILANYPEQAADIWAVNSPTGAVIREHYPDLPKWKFGPGSYHPVAVLARMVKDATKPLELVP